MATDEHAPRATYDIPVADAAVVRMLSERLRVPRVVAHLLVVRGIRTVEDAEEFLSPDLARDWNDPLIIPGLGDAADRVRRAIDCHERICIFGDFDVDGISATALLTRALRRLGAEVVAIVPHRLKEGYGLSEASVERIVAQKPNLVVTVDNGISAADEVRMLQEGGIDVVVTDHHEPAESVPEGVPVADPKLDPECPSGILAGAGVALKLVQLLGAACGIPDLWIEYIDLATLGTIADQMSLTGENRALVAEGVRRMNERPGPALLAYDSMSAYHDPITSEGLSFSLLPRINSAGRMGDPMRALNLLLADTFDDALVWMRQLEDANNERREAEAQLTDLVRAELARSYRRQRGIVVGGEGWHEGVKGIVASRIAGEYGVPTILFSIDGDIAHGSGRSVGRVNLFAALESCSDLFVKFGGHAAAVGITMRAELIPQFRERLVEVLDRLPQEQFAPETKVDMEVALSEVTLETIVQMERLEPFGQDNASPRFLVRSVFLDQQRRIGKPPVHFKALVSDGTSEIEGIYFRAPDLERLMTCEEAVDVVFQASRNEFRGNVSPQLMIRSVVFGVGQRGAQAQAESTATELVEELFLRSTEFLDRGDYAGILDARSFHTKVVGVTFERRQEVLARIEAPCSLRLVREPDNEYDAGAIAVFYRTEQIGYLKTALAARLAPAIDAGAVAYRVTLEERTGGTDDRAFGANIVLEKDDREADQLVLGTQRTRLREATAGMGDDELTEYLRRLLIGEHELHQAQRDSLAALCAGRSTLCVMATGRGKSLIFHLHAARIALMRAQASVFVFPLRALVADQAFHIQEMFAGLGLHACVLTGESGQDERDSVFGGMARGAVDCVLTTPEFLCLHAARFAQTGRVGFVVVDEAHHVGMSRSGHRPAYAQLGEALQALGNPTTFACTATASDDVARGIIEVLGIDCVVCDATVRENLAIDDSRESRARATQLAHIVGSGGKAVIYVNSREQATQLAHSLRKRLPALAGAIAYYHAGLPRDVRKKVERAFHDGTLQAIVSTSAFGEGVNIPDIRHVILYHMPFSEVEFNQMSGRAGRDGAPACVHLLFSKGDARINEKILGAQAPSRDDLVELYRFMRVLSRSAAAENGWFSMTNADIAEGCMHQARGCKLDDSGVSSGIAVFRELGFVETRGNGSARSLRVIPSPSRVNLAASTRYAEGIEQYGQFGDFKAWVLSAPAAELLARFNRPILPSAYAS